MIIVGIDPGKTGGICALDGNEIKHLIKMPDDPMDVFRFLERVAQYDAGGPKTHVFLERAQAMPKNGAVSMFNYGTHYGMLQMAILSLGLPHTLVPPMTWCKVIHSGTKAGKPKERSLEAVKRLFPGVRLVPEGSRGVKPHEGLIDALLIAEYGRRVTKP